MFLAETYAARFSETIGRISLGMPLFAIPSWYRPAEIGVMSNQQDGPFGVSPASLSTTSAPRSDRAASTQSPRIAFTTPKSAHK